MKSARPEVDSQPVFEPDDCNEVRPGLPFGDADQRRVLDVALFGDTCQRSVTDRHKKIHYKLPRHEGRNSEVVAV